MKRKRPILALMLTIGLSCAFGLAQDGGYVVVNNSTYPANSVTGFKTNAAGAMQVLKTVQTGGLGSTGDFGQPTIAIGRNARCMYVVDAYSNGIAVFKGPSFSQAASEFTNPQLTGGYYGISLAIDPQSRFLYTAWSQSLNSAVLAIAPDCSLSLVGDPLKTPYAADGLTVTRDGKVLVISYPNNAAVQAYKTSAKGTLTVLGPPLVFSDVIADCASIGCYPAGQDVTNDDVYWVWGNFTGTTASTLTATLTPTGFTNAAIQTYPDSAVGNVVAPWFSPAAASNDNGNLYLGATGIYGPFLPGGFLITSFDHGTVTYQNYVANGVAFLTGAVQTIGTTGTGSPLVQVGNDLTGGYNDLYSYTVEGNTATAVGTLQNPVEGEYTYSIATFPARP